MMIYAVNQSTKVDHVSFVLMVKAVNAQLSAHACPDWDRRPSNLAAVTNLDAVPHDSPFIVLLDDSDQAGVLGYHDKTPDGRAYGRVFAKPTLDNGGTLYQSSDSVSVTLSHEVLELWGDKNVNMWFDSNEPGMDDCGELCDAVEDQSYTIIPYMGAPKVHVSDYVLPEYFDFEPSVSTTKFDRMGVLKGPFTVTSGGYRIRRSETGQVTSVFGEEYPDWKRELKAHPASRTFKRLSRRALADIEIDRTESENAGLVMSNCAHKVLRFHGGGKIIDCAYCGVTWRATDHGFEVDSSLIGEIRTDPHTEFEREEQPTKPEEKLDSNRLDNRSKLGVMTMTRNEFKEKYITSGKSGPTEACTEVFDSIGLFLDALQSSSLIGGEGCLPIHYMSFNVGKVRVGVYYPGENGEWWAIDESC
jgi:hypothetical protein